MHGKFVIFQHRTGLNLNVKENQLLEVASPPVEFQLVYKIVKL